MTGYRMQSILLLVAAFVTGIATVNLSAQEAVAFPQRDLDCRAIPADCAKEIAVVENLIMTDPTLAALRQATDARISFLKSQPGITERARQSIDDDEARYRRSLKRDLFFAEGQAEVNRAMLEDAMTYRYNRLLQLSLTSPQIAGYWSNASGSLIVHTRDDGTFLVFANPVDIDDLGWTCELEGIAVQTDNGLLADLGDHEMLELNLVDGMLHTAHRNGAVGAPPSLFCGAGGHGGGIWFRESSLTAPMHRYASVLRDTPEGR